MRERTALLAAGLLLLVGLTLPLTAPDETRYSEIPKEMVAGGDWIVPHRHGEPYLDKPPLHYWLVAASYEFLGPRPGLVRWPSVLGAVFCVGILYLLGRKLYGETVALSAAVILAAMPGLQVAAHYGSLDVLFTLWMTLGQLSLWLGLRRSDRVDYRWIVGAGLSCGLGLLTKGPVALVLAVPPVLLWDWLRGNRLRVGAWAAFGSTAALVAGPWFVAVSLRQPSFWQYFFVRHNLARFAGTLEHQRSWWFFIPVVLVGLLPFSLLIPRVATALFKVDPELRRQRTEEMGVALMAAVWPVFFFSISVGKLAPYVLPAFPFMALVLAWYFSLLPRPHSRLRATHLVAISAALGFVLLANGASMAGPFGQPWGTRTQAFWLVLWLIALTACWTVRARRFTAATIAGLLLSAQLLATALPAAAKAHSLFGLAAAQAERLGKEGPLAVVLIADEDDTMLVMERYPLPILQLDPADHRGLQILLEDRGELVLVSEPKHVAWLAGEPAYRMDMVDGRGHVFHLARVRALQEQPAETDGAT